MGYVDDGAYSCGHKDPAILSDILTEKFDNLSVWMQNNKLVNDPDKTNLLVLGPKKFDRKRNEVSITAGNFTIKPTDTAKLLGCWIHQSLKWNRHLLEGKSSLVHQLTMRNNALNRVSKNASFSTKLMIANGVFHSKLVYMITVWGGAPQYLINALQVQQLRAARTVCGFQSMGWSRRRLLR